MIEKIVKWGVVFPISLYRLYSPLPAGKGVMSNFVLGRIWGKLTNELTVYTKAGIKFVLHYPEDIGWEYVYLAQNYEIGTTNLLKAILKPEDIVFDIGANFGWYTILLSKIVKQGQCHAFEPVPLIYEELKSNCSLNKVGANVFLNQVAIGNTKGIVCLHTFSGICHGLSSISSLGRDDFSISEAQMITLNEYIRVKNIKRVDFIKCDVEGAEFDVLKGSCDLLSLEIPPMWLFEANEETAKAFNHRPSDLFTFLRNFHDYRFYRVEHAWGRFLPMETVHDYEHGDTVLCIVPQFHEERLSKVI